MKNSLLLMFTLLGAPGFVFASSDLAASEYNFAVNELSKSSYNQAAIIGQQGVNNNATVLQQGSKLLSVVITLPTLIKKGTRTVRVLIKVHMVIPQ